MPKWWAISWTTVTVTSRRTCSRVLHMRSVGAAKDRDPVGE